MACMQKARTIKGDCSPRLGQAWPFFDGIVERLRGAHIVGIIFSVSFIQPAACIGTPHGRTLSRHEESDLNHLVRLTF